MNEDSLHCHWGGPRRQDDGGPPGPDGFPGSALQSDPEPIPALTRDPEDDYLIVYALIGRAEYLVTGDRDLLVLERVESVDILTPNAFGQLLSAS